MIPSETVWPQNVVMEAISQITVEQVGLKFFARCSYAQKDIVKAAGFRWDPNQRKWWTSDPAVAMKFADAGAAQKLMELVEGRKKERAQAVADSRASSCDIDIPKPEGLEYLPYQRAGINYALNHPSMLFGDEMGLGKTIQAIGVINADETIKRVLVICPASLKLLQ